MENEQPDIINVDPLRYYEILYDVDGNHKYKSWTRGESIGKGVHRVYKFTLPDDETIYAGKIVEKFGEMNNDRRSRLRSEIRIHRNMNHKHIVKYVTSFQHERDYVIIMDYCENTSMDKLLKTRKQLTHKETRYYIKQIVEAVQYLHGKNIIHRDLKPGNIFLDDNLHVKVGDFGMSAQLSYTGERLTTICGTPNYIAPEVLEADSYNGCGYSFEVDIWSIGVIIYSMLIGRAPFETSDTKTTYRRIRDSIYYFPERVKISEDAKNLIRSCLKKEASDRIKLDDILKHPFFTEHYTPESLPISSLVMKPMFNHSTQIEEKIIYYDLPSVDDLPYEALENDQAID